MIGLISKICGYIPASSSIHSEKRNSDKFFKAIGVYLFYLPFALSIGTSFISMTISYIIIVDLCLFCSSHIIIILFTIVTLNNKKVETVNTFFLYWSCPVWNYAIHITCFELTDYIYIYVIKLNFEQRIRRERERERERERAVYQMWP